MSKQEKLMTPLDVSKITRLHEATIRRFAREGKIPFLKINHTTLRFKKSDILEWLNKQQSTKSKE